MPTQVTFVVDAREKRKNGKNEGEAIVGKLMLGEGRLAHVEKQAIGIGDYLWIATPKTSRTDPRAWRDLGLVVGPVVERKCVSDFNTTVRGGTHHKKQTLGMLRSRMPATYLIEGAFDDITSPSERKVLFDEMARMEVEDGFVVHRSDSFDRTVDYLKHLDVLVRDRLATETVADVLRRDDVASYPDLLNSLNTDVSDWTLKSKFGVFLLHVPHCHQKYVKNILRVYPTPNALKAALDAHSLNEPLLTNILEPGHKRAADAKKIANFFTSDDYPPPPNLAT